MKKEHNKLVRDKILKVLKKSGVSFSYSVIDNSAEGDKEFLQRLFAKLDEEILEFKNEPSIEELADIMEVVDALGKFYCIKMKDIMEVKKAKKESRGSFNNRIVLRWTWGDKH
jgi:predicted house-cleaning noncanonical NTP pyrophosphatase (MazG superfamily)